MKFLLKILFVVLFFVIALVIAGLFLPDSFKSVSIMEADANRAIVFDEVNNFRKWKEWSPWHKADSVLEESFKGAYAGKGGSMEWTSTILGNCILTITHSVYPESIAIDFDYKTDSKTVALCYFEPTPSGSKVNFTYNATNLSLWERYYVLFYKDEIDQMLKDGVKSLCNRGEQLKHSRIGDIALTEIEGWGAIIKIDSVTPEKYKESLESNLTYLDRFLERRELKSNGESFVMKFGIVNDSLLKYAAGYPFSERTWVWKTLEFIEIPSGRAATVSHYGDLYPQKAYDALMSYINDEKLEIAGVPWEIKLFNPAVDTNSTLWETKIYYPVK
ncbi:MAG: hypothetical protein JXA77_05435 [Bacteroidales bacterium]|nr:hypothetical protein [Bacteroidales bacterium]MBN2819745.1 hypothetical protein [Bacteroidales bacterium]